MKTDGRREPLRFWNVAPGSRGRVTSGNAMPKTDLSDVYRDYIACLNRKDWPKLGQFVDDDVIHNGRRVGL